MASLEAGDSRFALVDVREYSELERGILPNALSIPMSELETRWPEVPCNQTVICYCEHGIRSLHAAAFLRFHGLDAISLKHGFSEWHGPVAPAPAKDLSALPAD